MIQFLKSLSPKTRILLALILGGIIIFLFWATLFGFLSARHSIERVNQYDVAIGLAQQTNADFQLAVSKAKNFAILKDGINKARTQDYFKRAKETFGQLSVLERDPQGKDLLYRIGAALKSVEFSLGILTSTARKNDPAEKLYSRYLRDITIDFDDSSQAYVDFLEGKIRSAQLRTASETQLDLLFALAGALLALAGMGLSYSIARNLNQALKNETASQERYQMLSEVTREGIMVHEKGIILDVNQALLEMTGMTASDLIGTDGITALPGESAEKVRGFRKTGYPTDPYEITLRRKDGIHIPVEVHGRTFNFQGRDLRVARFWDLTERKKAEEALRRSEERFRAMLENSYEGITLIGADGKALYVSPSNKKLTGYETEERVGRSVLEMVHPDDLPRTQEALGYLLKNPGMTLTIETRVHHKSGEWLVAEVTATNQVDNPDIAGILINARDITGRKKMEQAAKESEERFRKFAEVTKEGIMIHDQGSVVDANPALAAMLGYDLPEVLEKARFSFLHPDSVETVRKRVEENYSAPYEIKARRKDGSDFPAEIIGQKFQFKGKELRVASIWDITERKKAEQALMDSEEKFRSLIENSHDVISVTGKDGLMNYISPSVKRVLGYEPAERIGKGYVQIMHPEDMERIKGEFSKLVGIEGASWTVEFRLKHKDGSWRHVESTGINLLGNPSVQGIVYNLRDITEKVKAEEALRQSEKNFRNLIEKSPDAILVSQGEKIVYVNPKLLGLLGYEGEEELLGKPGISIVHPDDQKTVIQRIQTLSGGGRTSPEEIRLVRRDGAELPVETASIGIQFEGAPAIMVNLRDITARKQAEAAARENQERYRSLVESMPDAVMVHDEEKVLFVNPSATRLFGAPSLEALLTMPFWTVVPPEFQKVVRERIRGTMERGVFNEPAERKLLKIDGTPLDVLVTSVPFNDRGRRVVLAIFSDISARKEAERKAQKYQRLAALGELAAGLAHEIRNPAAAISAQAQYLLKKTEQGAPSYDQLKDIIAQCDRLDTLVHDTLDYSPEKKFEERTEIPAKDLLQKTLWLAQTQFGPSHARVQVILDVEADLPLLKIHPTRMERVLVNLILNAFQAMPEGGHLLLRANRQENKAILRVEDDGKGISDQEMSRLFEPFFTSRKMGSGLGLSICQKIVEEHGGQIRVDRVDPRGAAFTIEIPIQQ